MLYWVNEWVSEWESVCHEHLVFRSYLNSCILKQMFWVMWYCIEHTDIFTYTIRMYDIRITHCFVMSYSTCTYFLFVIGFPVRIPLLIFSIQIFFFGSFFAKFVTYLDLNLSNWKSMACMNNRLQFCIQSQYICEMHSVDLGVWKFK